MKNRNQFWQTMMSGKRLFSEKNQHLKKDNRSVFDTDHDRIVYSNYFRRMHDKTQVFPYAPLSISSQARSRLSHSLEVSCVGRSLGNIAGKFLLNSNIDVNPYDVGTIVATACLAHDIGNPPFGHAGEDAIQEWARKNLESILTDPWEKNDLLNFEGNAQGLRILTRLEAWQRKGGLRPTLAMLGSFIKYPCASLKTNKKSNNVALKKFGYFKEDQESFVNIFNELNINNYDPEKYSFARHPLAFLSEAADDICYAVIDLEDAYHLGLISFDTAYELLAPIANNADDFKDNHTFEKDLRLARLRSAAISSMINQCIDIFEKNINAIENFELTTSLIDNIKNNAEYKEITSFSLDNIYTTNRVLEIECAGFKAIGGLLNIFIPSIITDNPNKEEEVYRKLIPKNLFKKHDTFAQADKDLLNINQLINSLSVYQRILAITDYLASMTDRYAIELYQRLSGIKLPMY